MIKKYVNKLIERFFRFNSRKNPFSIQPFIRILAKFGQISFHIILKIFRKFLPIFFRIKTRSKKQKFSLTIIISSLLTFFWWKWLPFLFPAYFIFKTVGWIIPGLFASTLDRDGFLKTLLFTLLITTALFLFYQYGFLALQ